MDSHRISTAADQAPGVHESVKYPAVNSSAGHVGRDQIEIPMATGADGHAYSWIPGRYAHMLLVGASNEEIRRVLRSVIVNIAALGAPVAVLGSADGGGGRLESESGVTVVTSDIDGQVASIDEAHSVMNDRFDELMTTEGKGRERGPRFLVIEDYRSLLVGLRDHEQSSKKATRQSGVPSVRLLQDLIRLGRAARVHLVIGTDRLEPELLPDDFWKVSLGGVSSSMFSGLWGIKGGESIRVGQGMVQGPAGGPMLADLVADLPGGHAVVEAAEPRVWSVTSARAQLAALLDAVLSDEPQIIRRSGQDIRLTLDRRGQR